MTITSERVEELRSDVHLARIRDGRDDALVAVRAGVLSALLDAYEDQQPDHTCHDRCQRTECVLRRERDALVEGVRELCATLDEESGVAMHPQVASHAAAVKDTLTALLARVEGERHE